MDDLIAWGIYELVTNHPPMPVEPLLSKLASEFTRRTYRLVIAHFLAWIERDPLLADALVISNYAGELLEYRTPEAVILRLQIISHLLQEAVENGLLKSNPAARVPLPEATPHTVPIVSREVAAARLADCPRSTERGRRDYALYLMLSETDVQPDEVIDLKVADYEPAGEESCLWVRRSSPRTAIRVALSADVARALDEHLSGREVADDSPLF